MGECMIKRSDLEGPPFERDPTDFIPATSSQPNGVPKTKEQSDQLYLLIMLWSGKRNIPSKNIIKKMHTICHQSLVTASNT
jgi:hypothetical protein